MTAFANTIEWPPPGMERARLGDVINYGGLEHICTRVNYCSSSWEPTQSERRTIQPRFDKPSFSVTVRREATRLCANFERGTFLRRLGEEGLREWLDRNKKAKGIMKLEPGDVIGWSTAPVEEGGKHGRFTVVAVSDKLARIASTNCANDPNRLTILVVDREQNEFLLIHRPRLRDVERANELKSFLAVNAAHREKLTKEPSGEEIDTTMAKKTTAKKATAKAPKKQQFKSRPNNKKQHRGGDDKLFGFSATAVLRRFGKEGITAQRATEIFNRLKINVSPVTITAWIGNGKRGTWGKPAPLTSEQFAKLTA